ncbi:hypothetical protein [Mesorhizobium sp. M0859]|uniref:hypothetical protein n=1 Tax=Mesorhizobium sp. M0859 TaxID=2957014 RepID=UPI003338289F
MFIKAIHTIMRANDAKPPVVYPNGIAELEGEELESMLALRAVVEATDDEITLAGFKKEAAPILVQGKPEKTKASFAAFAEAKAAAKAEAKAAAKAEAEAAKLAEAEAVKLAAEEAAKLAEAEAAKLAAEAEAAKLAAEEAAKLAEAEAVKLAAEEAAKADALV